MDWTSNVAVHESAFPEVTRDRILKALRHGVLDSSLLYSGIRQTLRWIELHKAFSPIQQESDCAELYQSAFRRGAELCKGDVVHVISLACGDGTKDVQCLKLLRESGRAVIYTPADFSLEMVLSAERTATSALRGLQDTPLVCDLLRCSVLPALLKGFDPSGAERIILFLGTIHNFWPPEILRSVLYPLRTQDQLLIGANLAPVDNYNSTLNNIIRQYDNPLTRHWLAGALYEMSLGETEGRIEFSLQPSESIPSLKRIQADFIFEQPHSISLFGEKFVFERGQKLRVFYSYRFTPEHLRNFCAQAGLKISQEWIAANGEEGLFLCARNSDQKI